MSRLVYNFAAKQSDGDAEMREVLGGKGANLAEMCRIGLPVPPGFTISTSACEQYHQEGGKLWVALKDEVLTSLKCVEGYFGSVFGGEDAPLLVSVRSGARVSMPGMMDTVLNLGLNEVTVEALARNSGDPRFAYDSYRRFIQMYGNVVLGVEHHLFEDALEDLKHHCKVDEDHQIPVAELRNLIKTYLQLVKEETEQPFPSDVYEQLWAAIGAVFKSWYSERARVYRKIHDIPESWGTAVNVQVMVYGNMGNDCATGVAFTRNPSSGENQLYGEYLINAQGEDVVAGIRTPCPIVDQSESDTPTLEQHMPEVFQQFVDTCRVLESHYHDMQDIEFTVERNRLFILQTRNAKRTSQAAVRIAVEMCQEGLITEDQALLQVNARDLDTLLHPIIDPSAGKEVLGSGLPASPGAAQGRVVFDADTAEHWAQTGEKVILLRIETSPEDIHGMHAAEGIITARGGMTSHAAVVARGMGTPCVSGVGALNIDRDGTQATLGGTVLNQGDWLTLDGGRGEILQGQVRMMEPQLGDHFGILMQWASARCRLKVRANAETEQDIRVALNFGAEGIGLCRTEHMFFEGERILAMREMIISDNPDDRRRALSRIQPMQREDFLKIFTHMQGLPVTIRLLDPPLHEFLPYGEEEQQLLADSLGTSLALVQQRISALSEANPMLGHRGCRLLLSYPEIVEMQSRAIFEAAAEVKKSTGNAVLCEVMVPLVGLVEELRQVKQIIDEIATLVQQETGEVIAYEVGTMIELPRAALTAAQIAREASFFSFGTNDLTQTTFGLSRDDSSQFLDAYLQRGILKCDPFVVLDIEGVGALIRLAVEGGRATRPEIKLGICGEHGGDPASIHFCEQQKLSYVSCSAFRVPVARLAAAQAALLC
ncbi:MAG: pyruvate, phosphate dikinase [Alphaproteobacteria bacterium]|nr:pyruvate, phosphate dikinase [Alphaproteobacteria bacterium]